MRFNTGILASPFKDTNFYLVYIIIFFKNLSIKVIVFVTTAKINFLESLPRTPGEVIRIRNQIPVWGTLTAILFYPRPSPQDPGSVKKKKTVPDPGSKCMKLKLIFLISGR
jgi:hypothetical protein